MRAQRGFALMAALWLLVAISAVSLELSVLSHNRRLTVANRLEGAQAAAAAESGIEHARARLIRVIAEGGDGRTWGDPMALLDPWHHLDHLLPDSVSMGNARYRVTLRDLGAALNLNRVTEEDLRRYFAAKGIDAVLADRLAQCIMDWRDGDSLKRLRGAERDDYLKAGARVLPRNGPFASVAELGDVAGMTPEVLAKIRGDFTVFGGGQVNVNVAPQQILLSLPGMTPLAVDAVLRAQASNKHIGTLQELTGLVPQQARDAIVSATAQLLPRLTFDTHEVEAVSEGWLEGSPVRVREEAVIARGGTTAFVTWRRTE